MEGARNGHSLCGRYLRIAPESCLFRYRSIQTVGSGRHVLRTPHPVTPAHSPRLHGTLRVLRFAFLGTGVYSPVSTFPAVPFHASSRAASRPLAPIHILWRTIIVRFIDVRATWLL